MKKINDGFLSLRHRGFNLIEAAIVLGVIGIIIGGIWAAAVAVEQSRRINQVTELIGRISSDFGNTFIGIPQGWITAQDMRVYLIGKGFYSESDRNTPTVDLFKARELGNSAYIDYYGMAFNGPTIDSLRIRVWNINRSNCRRFISRLAPFLRPEMYSLATVQDVIDARTSTCESSSFVLLVLVP